MADPSIFVLFTDIFIFSLEFIAGRRKMITTYSPLREMSLNMSNLLHLFGYFLCLNEV